MFFSELAFWARYQPEVNGPADWALTWLAYSLLAYAFLVTAAHFRARAWPALFLCGALFGWLAEGVLVQTMFENFPVQIAWTGLAWHAQISVLFGWGYLRRCLQEDRPGRVWLVSGAAGLVWGVWAIFWWVEAPSSQVGLAAFASFAIVSSLLLALGYWAGFRLGSPDFTPGRWGPAVAVLLFALLFAFTVLPATPWAALVLPPLVVLVWLALRRNRAAEGRLPLTGQLSGRVGIASYLGLLGMPLGAIAVYALAKALQLRLFTNWLVFAFTVPAGTLLFLWSLFSLLRRSAHVAQPVGEER
jgi:hypothetical protein